MYVKEMHIEVMQATQRIAANRTRKLFPEEIDWLLNKNMERFIDMKVTPRKDGSGGFEIDQYDLDAIRTLVKARVPITAVSKENNKRYSSFLPGDYRNLLSDVSAVKKLCNIEAPERSIRTVNLLVIPIHKSVKAEAPFYQNVSLTVNNNVEFNITNYAADRNTSYNGYNSAEQVYEVVDAMMNHLIEKGFEVYWERYATKTFYRSLIIVSNNTLSGSVTIDVTSKAGVLHTYSAYVEDLPQVAAEESTNRLTATNIVDNLDGTPFWKTQPDAPLSELIGNELVVHADKTFIVSNVWISYVRKPRRISLILGQDCELSPSVHQNICDLVVEYYKNLIMSPDWEAKLKDNMVRTPV